jgi:hypothetical protein
MFDKLGRAIKPRFALRARSVRGRAPVAAGRAYIAGSRGNDRFGRAFTMDVLLTFLHVMAFVFWVGSDIGVLYAAHHASRGSYSRETRLAISEIMSWIDQWPRQMLPFILGLGFTLAVVQGYMRLPVWALPLIWAAVFVWMGAFLYVYRNRKSPEKTRAILTFDPWYRAAIALILLALGIAALLGFGPTSEKWLAAKLFLYAGAIGFALTLRVTFHPYRMAMAKLRAGTHTPADDAQMRASLARSRPVILSIYAMAILAALIGIWKPF